MFNLRYFKRYRMEIDLRRWRSVPLVEPVGYRLLPWSEELLEKHALVKHRSFREEIDAVVFPCFGDVGACLRLMREIRNKKGFLPEATWLAVARTPGEPIGAPRLGLPSQAYSPRVAHGTPCGTIQALRVHRGRANIQNIGVTPEHRGHGVGQALIAASLAGLQHVGVAKATLEVTADNSQAVKLYRRLGFYNVRTLYKAVEATFDPIASG